MSGPRKFLHMLLIVLLGTTGAGCLEVQMEYARWVSEPDPPPVPVGGLVIRDIRFATTRQGPLELDVYRPLEPGVDRLPVVLFVFGGGWMMGNRNQVGADLGLLRLIDEGYAVVAADYRNSGQAIFPAQIHDVRAALRWIRAFADDQGFDPDRVAIAGASAGGHLAALAGTSGDARSLDGSLHDFTPLERELPTRVQAVVDFFGPTDLSVYRAQFAANGLGNADRLYFLERFVGGPLPLRNDRVQMANPINYVTHETPPFFIVHGDADPVVPIQQSELLVSALEEAGVPVEFHIIRGGGHGRSPAFASDALFAELVSFLDRSLGIDRTPTPEPPPSEPPP